MIGHIPLRAGGAIGSGTSAEERQSLCNCTIFDLKPPQIDGALRAPVSEALRGSHRYEPIGPLAETCIVSDERKAPWRRLPSSRPKTADELVSEPPLQLRCYEPVLGPDSRDRKRHYLGPRGILPQGANWPGGLACRGRLSHRFGNTLASISFARNAGSYCSSPSVRSQSATSIADRRQ